MLSEWKNVLELVIAFSGASAVIVGAWMWLAPKVQSVIHFWQDFSKLHDDVKFVKEELTSNGGGSVKDAVDRTENKIEEVSRDLYLVRGVQRAMMNRTKIGFFETDAQGRCVWVSRYYLELTGKQLGDVLVNGWGSCISSEDRQKVLAEWNDCIKNDRDFEMDYHIVGVNDRIIPIRGQAKRVKTSDGLTIAFAGSIIEKNYVDPAFTSLFAS